MRTEYAVFNYLELEIPTEAIGEICQAGPNDAAVEFWVGEIDWSDVTPGAIKTELGEYGAWDEDALTDEAQNRHRILWCGAWNIHEDEERASK